MQYGKHHNSAVTLPCCGLYNWDNERTVSKSKSWITGATAFRASSISWAYQSICSAWTSSYWKLALFYGRPIHFLEETFLKKMSWYSIKRTSVKEKSSPSCPCVMLYQVVICSKCLHFVDIFSSPKNGIMWIRCDKIASEFDRSDSIHLRAWCIVDLNWLLTRRIIRLLFHSETHRYILLPNQSVLKGRVHRSQRCMRWWRIQWNRIQKSSMTNVPLSSTQPMTASVGPIIYGCVTWQNFHS